MSDIFHDLLLVGHVIIYMDDILIFTDDITTHRLITRQVLAVLQKHNLFLKPEKCSFETKEVEYLGVVISQGQLKMDAKKIEALATWPTPIPKRMSNNSLVLSTSIAASSKTLLKLPALLIISVAQHLGPGPHSNITPS